MVALPITDWPLVSRYVFEQGWVEFREKKNAKRAVAALDMTAVSNRRRSRWVDQFWTLKYLRSVSSWLVGCHFCRLKDTFGLCTLQLKSQYPRKVEKHLTLT